MEEVSRSLSIKDELTISEKKIALNSKETIIFIIKLNCEEGLTIPQVADMFNTSSEHIRKSINRHALATGQIVPKSMKALKNTNVIPLNTPKTRFVPKDSIKSLVKIINSPTAWTIYFQLWDDEEKLREENEHLRSKVSFQKAEIESLKSQTLKKKRICSNKIHTRTVVTQDLFGGQEVNHVYESIPSDAMTPEQQKTYKAQHSVKTMNGIASRLVDATEELGGWLFIQAKKTKTHASRLKTGLLPPEGKHEIEIDILG